MRDGLEPTWQLGGNGRHLAHIWGQSLALFPTFLLGTGRHDPWKPELLWLHCCPMGKEDQKRARIRAATCSSVSGPWLGLLGVAMVTGSDDVVRPRVKTHVKRLVVTGSRPGRPGGGVVHAFGYCMNSRDSRQQQ